jgi:hypothetical protein
MTNRSGIRSLSTQTHFDHSNCLIDSDREKNSALTEAILKQTKTGNSGFLGQKLIFRPSKVLQYFSYFQKNCEKNLIFMISTSYSVIL